jgi:hypothetical protein
LRATSSTTAKGRAIALATGLAVGLPFAFRGNLATGVAHGVANLGVLRRSGTVHQFRHAHLQQRLAISQAQPPPAPVPAVG